MKMGSCMFVMIVEIKLFCSDRKIIKVSCARMREGTPHFWPAIVLQVQARAQPLLTTTTGYNGRDACGRPLRLSPGGREDPGAMEGAGRVQDQPETVQGPAQVHLLRRAAVRHRPASLRPHSGRNDKGEVALGVCSI